MRIKYVMSLRYIFPLGGVRLGAVSQLPLRESREWYCSVLPMRHVSSLKSHSQTCTSISTCSILAHFSEFCSILPEQKRSWHSNDNCYERQQTVTPSVVELSVHVRCKEREAESSHGTQENNGRCAARCITSVAVYQIRLRALMDGDTSSCKKGGSDVRCDPMNMVLRGPSIDENAYPQ
jgi:hypothetical protein